VSVLVPARNEEAAIGRLCRDVLASEGVDLELVILDDASQDGTAAVVAGIAAEDPRVRLVPGSPLPAGWCGKQHACWQLARAARHDTWVFFDVDVSPTPDAVARAVAFLDVSGAALGSGFPRQRTACLLDWLLLPLIHFILLGFLPLARSRRDNVVGMAAGCGQFFVTRRAAYDAAGGHAAIRASLHDGVKLPRAYRRAGLTTDLFDATGVASCRMYDRDADVWRGLSKNATEGIGGPATIVPFTLLLAGGQILRLGAARGPGRRRPRLAAAAGSGQQVPPERHERPRPSAGRRDVPRHPVDGPGAQDARAAHDLAGPQPRAPGVKKFIRLTAAGEVRTGR
jgi:glycosyltransferase involved in cell wall biosynthesis